MKFSQQWLQAWVATTLSDLNSKLTMAGLEVESITDLSDDDQSVELSITPNRADCLSILGLAREVSMLYGVSVTPESFSPPVVTTANTLLVNNQVKSTGCPYYAGRVITGLNFQATTPTLIAHRLLAGGQRLVHPVVDILNYVLLEMGQPLHAFDKAKLTGTLTVRFAETAESIVLLDGQAKSLTPDTLVIADATGPQAIAGVMGAATSAVSESTTSIFLESAYFMQETIAGKARAYGLASETAHRFERGINPLGVLDALERASALIITICGGEAGPVKSYGALPVLARSVILRRSRITKILGLIIPDATVVNILTRLGAVVTPNDVGWIVEIPTFRHDCNQEIDLIEELARVYGYNTFGDTPGNIAWHALPAAVCEVPLRAFKQLLVAREYQEVITYSFIDPQSQKLLDPSMTPLALANPISPDKSVMRTQLWAGLLETVRHNQNRQQTRMRLFESGLRFVPGPTGLVQTAMLSGVITGPRTAEQWGLPLAHADYYDIAGDVMALAALTGQSETFALRAAEHPALHPGQSAGLYRNQVQIGWVGMLHPKIQNELGLVGAVGMFEVALHALKQTVVPTAIGVSKFPSIRRDIAILLQETVAAAPLLALVQKTMGHLLQEAFIFDVYRGKGVPAGQKSVALGLILQEISRTLVEEEVEAKIQGLIAALQQSFGATLRS